MIQDIGAWVFDQAAKAIKHWNAAVGDDFRGQISVNMSPRQFTSGNGCDMAIACLKAHGVAPKQIAIEITEGLLLLVFQKAWDGCLSPASETLYVGYCFQAYATDCMPSLIL